MVLVNDCRSDVSPVKNSDSGRQNWCTVDQFMVNSLLGQFDRFIGQFAPWSFCTSTEPKSTRHSVFFTPFRVKSVVAELLAK